MAAIRPARPDDFLAFLGHSLPYRSRAFAVEDGGNLLGIGGLAYLPDGTIGAFVHQVAGARQCHKITMHKAGLMIMQLARELGIPRVVAMADPDVDTAVAWLKRLGFVERHVGGHTAYVWERQNVE